MASANWHIGFNEAQTEGTLEMQAQAYDNRIDRKAAVLDAARPFVAVKPKGFLNPVIGHYETMKSAKAAAKRFNEKVAK